MTFASWRVNWRFYALFQAAGQEACVTGYAACAASLDKDDKIAWDVVTRSPIDAL